jgi:hypothetical protein
MAAEHEPVEIDDKPELRRLVEDVEATGRPRVLCRNGKAVAIVRPLADEDEEPGDHRTTSEDDPLWRIVGAVTSGSPSDVARNKYKYLAEAYADNHDNQG